MKTMTCKQLGGPCDLQLHGNTADEIIKAQDKHLKELVASGDESHQSAHQEMKGRWKRPISGLLWYKKTKRDFAALPSNLADPNPLPRLLRPYSGPTEEVGRDEGSLWRDPFGWLARDGGDAVVILVVEEHAVAGLLCAGGDDQVGDGYASVMQSADVGEQLLKLAGPPAGGRIDAGGGEAGEVAGRSVIVDGVAGAVENLERDLVADGDLVVTDEFGPAGDD